jgi:hypothetical protein
LVGDAENVILRVVADVEPGLSRATMLRLHSGISISPAPIIRIVSRHTRAPQRGPESAVKVGGDEFFSVFDQKSDGIPWYDGSRTRRAEVTTVERWCFVAAEKPRS